MSSSTISRVAVAATLFASIVSAQNVAMYWGNGDSQIALEEVCNDPSIDIVNIGFVNGFPQKVGDYPKTNFANACWGDYYPDPNDSTKNSGLLKTCPTIGPGIKTCQKNNKKVLLSLGGGYPRDYYLPSEPVAKYFAEFLMNAFGPVTKAWTDKNGPRPFGDAVVDGFDLDLEADAAALPSADFLSANYAYFVNRLKAISPSILISSAPQCQLPDVRLADAISKAPFDYVFTQFYNTETCSARLGYSQIDKATTGFTFKDWAEWLQKNSYNKNVKLYLGLPAGPAGAGKDYASHYLKPEEAHALVDKWRAQYPNIFGGIMLWEATVSAKNVINCQSYDYWMKAVLKGSFLSEFKACTSSSSSSVMPSSSAAPSSTKSASKSASASATKSASSSVVSASKSATPSSTKPASKSASASATKSASSSVVSASKSASSSPFASASKSASSSVVSASASASSSPIASASKSASSSVVSASASASTGAPSSVVSASASASTGASSSVVSASASASTGASSSVVSASASASTGASSSVVSASASASASASKDSSAAPSIVYPAGTTKQVPAASSTPAGPSSTPCSTSTGHPFYPYSSSSLVFPTFSSVPYPIHNVSSVLVYPESTPAASSTPCSTSSKGYTASSSVPIYAAVSSSAPEYPVNVASSKAPEYPVYAVPSKVPEDAASSTTKVITTTYVDSCETGVTTKTQTITQTICAKCTQPPKDDSVTSVYVCKNCGPSVVTITITKPNTPATNVPSYPTSAPVVPAKPSSPVYGGDNKSSAPVQSSPSAKASTPVYGNDKPNQPIYSAEFKKQDDKVISSTVSTVVIAKTPVPVVPLYTPVPYSSAPAKNGTSSYPTKPTGTGVATKPSSYAAAQFTGAASRLGAGMTAVVAIVAGLLVL